MLEILLSHSPEQSIGYVFLQGTSQSGGGGGARFSEIILILLFSGIKKWDKEGALFHLTKQNTKQWQVGVHRKPQGFEEFKDYIQN